MSKIQWWTKYWHFKWRWNQGCWVILPQTRIRLARHCVLATPLWELLALGPLILSSVPSILLSNSSTEVFLISVIIFFSSKIFIWYLSLLFLCWDFSSFHMFIIIHWSIFIIARLNYLSENSHISVISVFTSTNYFLSFHLRSF